MSRLFGRRATVTVGSVRISSDGELGMRFAFGVKKTRSQEPNTCDLQIHNLNASTRGRLSSIVTESAGGPAGLDGVTLEAGYAETIGAVFVGRVKSLDHIPTPTGWITRVRAVDGGGAQNAQAKGSFAPGSRVADVIADLAKGLGEQAGIAVSKAIAAARAGRLTGESGAIQIFASGFTADGPALRKLARLGEDYGFSVSIQDGELELGPAVRQSIVLRSGSGLVGSPEHFHDDARPKALLVRAKALLEPKIYPGGAVDLDSRAITGRFKVLTVAHAGDTHGSAWNTDLEGEAAGPALDLVTIDRLSLA